MRSAALMAMSLAPNLAVPADAEVCVTNGTDDRHLFAAETREIARNVRWLEPGATLCADGSADGVVSVFEAEDALEGCSRLVAAGETETLLQYVDFDRCRWSSHER